jgi:molybdopterin synthase sulfur carrier subunit
MVIRYFAWMRDHTGCAHERLSCPDHVHDVRALISYLCERSPGHQTAFANQDIIRVAINHEFADLDDAISDDMEVAFFPPVTGG